MFEYFYNEILRRTIISFGTLFNGITIKQDGGDIRVPLAYGPTQKFLARLTQTPDLNKATAITLPRMSFEFTGLTYDPARKVTTTQQFTVKDPTTGSESKKAYMPVPYNMQFELAIMCKLNDDALQITEQILPYFQPAYNVTVTLVESIKEKRDIPIILENITMQDDYEGDFEQRRVLLYTLRFSAKTYLFGPVSSATDDIIKKVRVSYLSGTDTSNTTRDLTYTVTPRAVKSYDGPVITTLSENVDLTEVEIKVVDGDNIAADQYIDIDGEEMLVIQKNSDGSLIVERAKDNTTASAHVKGADVRVINPTVADNTVAQDDNALIAEGDDFGFDGTIS
mgnify:FL=1|tara:strand:+ start:21 stop:1034 length:1014 start_codon:yes stop_codon:yes gene_type:complete